MMISPEVFYEWYLKGKDPSQILSKIRALKNNIRRLKTIIEEPVDELIDMYITPTPSTELWCNQLYLERAKEALVEAGGTYQPSRAELRAEKINSSIPYIKKLLFSIGRLSTGHETTTISFDDEIMKVQREHTHKDVKQDVQLTESAEDIEDFLLSLQGLDIGDWKSTYNNPDILDGEQWSLELWFTNGKRKVSFSGSNKYPYNFPNFRSLIGEWLDIKLEGKNKSLNQEA